MESDQVIFRVHAIQRMFERAISETDVRDVLENGEVIETYDDASKLMLMICGGRPLHVLACENPEEDVIIVITVYEPDPEKWDSSFRQRR